MKLAWSSVIAVVVSIASSASAEEPRPAFTPEAQQTRVGVEIDLLHTPYSTTVTADLVAQVGVTRHVFLDADVPMGLLVGSGLRAGLLGVPTFGAHYAGHFNRRTSGFVGIAVGIPIAGSTVSQLSDEHGRWATGMRAWQDPYRFLPSTLPFVARAGLEVDLAPAFLRFEASPGLLVFLRHLTGAAYVNVTATAGVRARFGLEGGVSGLGTFVLSPAEDHAQMAIEPFIGYASPEAPGLYVRYGLLAALDTPLGVGGYGIVTHRLSIGAKL